MIYVYALTDALPSRAMAALGLNDHPIRLASRQGISAVYSQHDTDCLAPTKANLLRHEQVAETLLSESDLLPARFGVTFPTEEKLCGVLERHAATLQRGLDRVRRCVELGLRVLWQPDTGSGRTERTAAASGREYMLARLATEHQRRREEERAQCVAEMLQTPLLPLAREHSWRLLATPSLLLTAAYLVQRERVDEFRRRVQTLGAEHPELRLLCTGPWPPYHFAPVLPGTEPHHA